MTKLAAPGSTLIVVPVFNHAASLPHVLTGLMPLGLPVLVVDDGSSEELPELRAFPRATLLRHTSNLGKGAAIVSGMRYAAEHGFSSVLSFDADGQHLPEAVPLLLAAHQAKPEALLIGSRDFASPASGEVPGSSKFGRSFSNFWIWVESGQWLSDTQSGLRLYPLDLDLLASIHGERYAFEIEVITRSIWRGREVLTVPVPVYYPPRGERISHFHAVSDNARLSWTHTRMCVLRCLLLLRLYRPRRLSLAPSPQSTREVKGMGLTAWGIRHFGVHAAYALLAFPVLGTFLCRARERRAVAEFYRRSRPQWGALRRRIAVLRTFAMFAASIIDRTRPEGEALVIDLPDQAVRDLQATVADGGLVILGAHFGDWMLIARKIQPHVAGPLGLVLDPSVTPRFFAELEARLGNGLKIINPNLPALDFALTVKEVLDARGVVCFLADRVPSAAPAEALLPCPFLGAPAQWFRSPFMLAARLGAPVFFVCATKESLQPSARYHILMRRLADGTARSETSEVLRRFVQALEEMALAAPQHWFNFFPFWQQGETR